MPKCITCTRKYSSTMGFTCKYCNFEFCVSCISVDIHKCRYIDTRNVSLREQLSNKLTQGKTVDLKVQKIS